MKFRQFEPITPFLFHVVVQGAFMITRNLVKPNCLHYISYFHYHYFAIFFLYFRDLNLYCFGPQHNMWGKGAWWVNRNHVKWKLLCYLLYSYYHFAKNPLFFSSKLQLKDSIYCSHFFFKWFLLTQIAPFPSHVILRPKDMQILNFNISLFLAN